MTPEAFFNQLWPICTAVIIVPLLEWAKKFWRADWPVRPMLLSVLLNFGLIYGLAAVLKLDLTFAQILPHVTAGFSLAVAGHSVVKTYKKNHNGGGQ